MNKESNTPILLSEESAPSDAELDSAKAQESPLKTRLLELFLVNPEKSD